MKVALVLTSLDNSGPIIVAYDLATMLVERGQKCEVFYFKDTIELDFPCPTHRISLSTQWPFQGFDVIHCHGLRCDAYIMLHKPLFSKIPVVTTFHSYIFRDHYYTYGHFTSLFTASLVLLSTLRDNKIVTLTKDSYRYYQKYILVKNKLFQIYNTRICRNQTPIGKDVFDKLTKFKGESPLLGTNCCVNARKNLDDIIKALPFIPNAKFCICGTGPAVEGLRELAKQLNVSDRVLFFGRHMDAYRLLPYYDVFVIPSRSEGFPLAMTEAASYGKAIVCSNIDVFQEIFTSQEVSMFELDNTESAVDAINYAIAHKEELGKNAKDKYIRCYSPNAFVDRHLELYKTVINETSK